MKKCNVLYQIKTLESLIAKEMISKILKNDEMPQVIPTPTQMRILDYIINNEDKEIYQKDLEDIFNLTRATISGVLHTMEKNDLILRVVSTKDTRTKKVILSPQTKSIFENNKKRLEKIEKVIVKDISEDELKSFLSVLEKMKVNLKKI